MVALHAFFLALSCVLGVGWGGVLVLVPGSAKLGLGSLGRPPVGWSLSKKMPCHTSRAAWNEAFHTKGKAMNEKFVFLRDAFFREEENLTQILPSGYNSGDPVGHCQPAGDSRHSGTSRSRRLPHRQR